MMQQEQNLQTSSKQLLTEKVTEQEVSRLTFWDKLPNEIQSLLVVLALAVVTYATQTAARDITLTGTVAALVAGALSWLTSERQKLIGQIQGATNAINQIVPDKQPPITVTFGVRPQDDPPKVKLGD
jgi:uncharacterized membrane protein